MKPILVVDAYLDPRGGKENYLSRFADRPAEVVRVAHEPCPQDASSYSSIFVSGSGASVAATAAGDPDAKPWVEDTANLLRDAAERRVPVLGICFGHQLLPYALYGPDFVRRTQTPELGWVGIERHGDHGLLDGFEPNFVAFESHRDEVVAAGDQLEVLASNGDCAVQAFAVRDLPCYGVQFHPEMGLGEIEALIEERAAEPAGSGFDAATLLDSKRDTMELGDRLFANFFRLIGQG